MKGIQAPVVQVGFALDESPFLEIIQHRYQPAWMNLHLPRQLLLAQSRRSAQQSQDSRIRQCASLSLVAYPANFFIPITMYLGFIWMFSIALALGRDRKGAQSVSISDAA